MSGVNFNDTFSKAGGSVGAVPLSNSDWIAFTPTGSFTTNTTYTGFWRRVGDSMEVKVQLAFAGAPNAVNLTVNLPSGYTIDTAKLTSSTGAEELLGEAYCLDTSVVQKHIGQVDYASSTSVYVLAPNSGSNAVTIVSNTFPFSFGSTDKIWVHFVVPIVGWTTSGGAGINNVEVTEASLASDFTITQAYSNVPGGAMAQVSTVQVVVNTLENEKVLVDFAGTVSQLGGGFRDVIYGYQVDSNTAVVVGDTNHETTSGQQIPIAFSVFTAALTAGQHTIKLMASRANATGGVFLGSGTGAYANNRFQVIRFKSDGIGAGTIATSSTVSADVDYSSATFADTGHTIAITTITNEAVTLSFTCMTTQITGVAGKALILAYKVDAGADVVIVTYTQANGNATDCSFSFTLPALSAGSHTIKLRARVDSTPASYRIFGTAGGQSLSQLQTVQYRGGIIPVMNAGVPVVDKPSDLDFTADFLITNPSALKAQIDLKILDLTAAGVLGVLTHNTTDLGTTGVRLKDGYFQGNITIAGTVDGRDVSADGVVLDETAADANDLITLSGVAENSASLGTFTGVTIPDSSTVKAALQSLETELELKAYTTTVTEIDANVDDLITLSGVAENSAHLGTFTGSIIADSVTVKAALQSLETQLETHDHSSTSSQARLAAKDRRRMVHGEKHSADGSAADTLSEHMLLQAQDAVTVTKVFFLPDAALTADNTDFATLTVSRRDADGTNKVTIASVSTTTGGSGSWVAFDAEDLGTITNSAISAGQVITWEITKSGTGVVVPSGTLQVECIVD